MAILHLYMYIFILLLYGKHVRDNVTLVYSLILKQMYILHYLCVYILREKYIINSVCLTEEVVIDCAAS